jgi:hypothetical protein
LAPLAPNEKAVRMQNPKPEIRRSRRGKNASGPSPRSARLKLPWSSGLLGVAVLFLAWAVSAQSQYSIDWTSLDAGGGASTGGVYTVSGTIGQPDAGTMTGGSFALTGGFWGLIAAVQTRGAPYLSIARTNNSARLTWPAAAGYTLEQTVSLPCSPSAWSAVSTSQYQTNGAAIVVNVPVASGNTFFRLHKP